MIVRVAYRAFARPVLVFSALMISALTISAFAALSTPVLAQTTDSTAQPMRPVSVSVTRDPARSVLELPYSLSRVTPDSLHPGLKRSSVGEFMFAIPGVQVSERNNPSQDPRLAIRGFGSRSAFGVRGVRVLRDGIPLTLPDGQTPIDWLDLESAGSVEVIRGTAASLYGNAAGGVISIRTREASTAPIALQGRSWSAGNQQRYSALASGSGPEKMLGLKSSSWLASVTRSQGDGVREYSEQQATSAFARALGTVGNTRIELQGVHYDAPTAQNPGAITAAELGKDPTLADSLNITKHARKAVEHSQVALTASRGSGPNEITASLFAASRTLDNPQAFAIVAVDRNTYGGSLRASTRTTVRGLPFRMTAGFDAQTQHDDRFNYTNCSDVSPTANPTATCPTKGAERGSVRLNQRENVIGEGAFARYELEAPHGVNASASLRYDQVRYELIDHFIAGTNGDDSGDRTLTAVSPMVGVVWRVRPLLSLYANAASAFETPTITELTNQPDGKLGLNQVLAPQRTRTVETGVQSILGAHVRLDAAVFLANAHDELISFDVPEAPGRRAFRNAGRTSRRGLETSATSIWKWGEVGAAYTWSRFQFEDYVVGTAHYDGNPIPGVPKHQAQTYATLRWHGWYATGETNSASRVSVDDAATTFAGAWTTVGARIGLAPTSNRYAIEPVVGVDNIFDRFYASSVSINATRSRYFEPGVRRRAFVGVRVAAAPWR